MKQESINVGDQICTQLGNRYLGVVSEIKPDPYNADQFIYLVLGKGWYRGNVIKPCTTRSRVAA